MEICIKEESKINNICFIESEKSSVIKKKTYYKYNEKGWKISFNSK